MHFADAKDTFKSGGVIGGFCSGDGGVGGDTPRLPSLRVKDRAWNQKLSHNTILVNLVLVGSFVFCLSSGGKHKDGGVVPLERRGTSGFNLMSLSPRSASLVGSLLGDFFNLIGILPVAPPRFPPKLLFHSLTKVRVSSGVRRTVGAC